MPLHMPKNPLLLLVPLLMLVGCGPTNYVRLHYASEHTPAHIQPNAPTVTVVELTDDRSEQDVGIRSDETPFIPVSSVTAWVSEALKEELSRQGLNTRYAKTAENRVPGDHVVTGAVQKVWVRQKNMSEYTVAMEMALTLDDNPPVNYRAEQEFLNIPTSSVTETQLTETLRTLLSGAVTDITAKLQYASE